MTLSGTIICSTCEHKIRIRHQIGYIYPIVVKIACNQCGKLIKGHIRRGNVLFDFPQDSVDMNYIETTQVVSISPELPIALKLSNTPSSIGLTPFLGIGMIMGNDNIGSYARNIRFFIEKYDAKFSNLVTCCELFENKNWKYFIKEAKKHFQDDLNPSAETFEESSVIINEILNGFFENISTNYYDKNFKGILKKDILNKVMTKSPELTQLGNLLSSYIDIENEFIKGVKLVEKFLYNIKSFLPVIALSYNNNYSIEYNDKIGLTTFEFLDLKEMYIEQFEYLSRISSLYFGLVNLSERNNINDFGVIRDCDSLIEYFAKNNGVKKDIIKKSPILNNYFLGTLDSQIRNGIGHLKTIYEPKTQIIKYYPYNKSDKINSYKEIYLIDFAVKVYEQSLKVRDSLEIISEFIKHVREFKAANSGS